MSNIKTADDYLRFIDEGYVASARQRKVNYLNYGPMGTGKTVSLLTASKWPIIVHSFDKTGSKSIRSYVTSNPLGADKKIHVDTRFELDNPMEPKTWDLWLSVLEDMKRADVFSGCGTFVVDSMTGVLTFNMYKVLKVEGRPGTWPQRQDYNPQTSQVGMVLNEILDFPCDVVINAHMTQSENEATEKQMGMPMLTGILKQRVPGNIDEVYVSIAENSSKSTIYKFQTKPANNCYARSRLDEVKMKEGKFITSLGVYEEANYKAIRAKLGYD